MAAICPPMNLAEQRLLEMGFVEGARVEIRHQGPLGRDPIAVKVNNAMVAVRRAEACAIFASAGSVGDPVLSTAINLDQDFDGPPLRVALVGNPSCGKTAPLNALTGSRQKAANYPGVTVERKEGRIRTPTGAQGS